MGKVIAIANQKGGVGKTTTNINLSACLALSGKKVLTIDFDPQGNTTSGWGIDKNSLKRTVYNLLLGECYLDDVIIKTGVNNVSLVPSNINLAGAEVELVSSSEREFLLRKIIKRCNNLYDYILIDCPPSLNMLTLNALTAADAVLVPLQCEYYALEGLSQLLKTIELVKKNLNPNLQIEGIVFTMFDSRTNLSIQVVDEVKKHLNEKIFSAMIPRNVRLSEAPSHGKPISEYDGRSKGADSYMNLALELIDKEE